MNMADFAVAMMENEDDQSSINTINKIRSGDEDVDILDDADLVADSLQEDDGKPYSDEPTNNEPEARGLYFNEEVFESYSLKLSRTISEKSVELLHTCYPKWEKPKLIPVFRDQIEWGNPFFQIPHFETNLGLDEKTHIPLTSKSWFRDPMQFELQKQMGVICNVIKNALMWNWFYTTSPEQNYTQKEIWDSATTYLKDLGDEWFNNNLCDLDYAFSLCCKWQGLHSQDDRNMFLAWECFRSYLGNKKVEDSNDRIFNLMKHASSNERVPTGCKFPFQNLVFRRIPAFTYEHFYKKVSNDLCNVKVQSLEDVWQFIAQCHGIYIANTLFDKVAPKKVWKRGRTVSEKVVKEFRKKLHDCPREMDSTGNFLDIFMPVKYQEHDWQKKEVSDYIKAVQEYQDSKIQRTNEFNKDWLNSNVFRGDRIVVRVLPISDYIKVQAERNYQYLISKRNDGFKLDNTEATIVRNYEAKRQKKIDAEFKRLNSGPDYEKALDYWTRAFNGELTTQEGGEVTNKLLHGNLDTTNPEFGLWQDVNLAYTGLKHKKRMAKNAVTNTIESNWSFAEACKALA